MTNDHGYFQVYKVLWLYKKYVELYLVYRTLFLKAKMLNSFKKYFY